MRAKISDLRIALNSTDEPRCICKYLSESYEMSLENGWKVVLNLSDKTMDGENGQFLEFGDFRIDLAERELLKAGEPVPLTIKSYEVLSYLALNAGHTVTKDELMKAVWPDSFVEEANVTRIVHTLRKALGGEDNEHQFIRTVPKRGYRFVAEVKREKPADGEPWPTTIEEFIPESTTAERRALPYLLIGSTTALFLALIGVFLFSGRELSPPAAKPISIAVLPFRPINLENRNQIHELAFANDLILALNRSKVLRVRPFSTMRVYTDVTQDPIAIGKAREVDYVLESHYVDVDGRLEFTSNLFNVASGSVDATFKYVGDNRDILAVWRNVESKMVPDVLAKLNLQAVTPLNRANDEAWRSYVQGMALSNKRSVEDAEKAVAEFEKAIRLDPNYAAAYMGLAYSLGTISINGGDWQSLCPRTFEAATKAFELDPTSGDALVIVASNKRNCRFEIEESNRDFERAVELSPNSDHVRRFVAVNIMNEGRFDEALEHIRVAKELDPNVAFNEKLLGRVLFFARRYDQAIEQSKKAKDIDPEVEQTSFVFMSYELKGDLDKAFEWFLVVRSLDGEKEDALNAWRAAYAASGWQGILRRRLEKALELESSTESVNKRARLLEEITTLCVQLEDRDRAFEYMNRAVDQYSLFAAQLLVNPYLDPVRSDPRYRAILARTWNRNGGNYVVF